MLLAERVSGERKMGEPGTTEAHTASTAQRAIGKETGRSARSSPGDGRRHDLYPDRVPMSDRSERSRPRDSVAFIILLTRTETQPFPFPAMGLTSLSRVMFEAFARP